MAFRTISLRVTITGGAGVATGQARAGLGLAGKLVGIAVKYTSQPATADVTLKVVVNGLEKTVLTIADDNTNVPLTTVKNVIKDQAGADVAANFEYPPLAGELVVDVAQGDPVADGVIVTCVVEA